MNALKIISSITTVIIISVVNTFQSVPINKRHSIITKFQHDTLRKPSSLQEMKRPILDQIATTLFKLETSRVESSSVEDEKGRIGEPMEWSDSNSLPNKFSQIVSNNSIGYMFKQFIADIIAGDKYDEITTQQTIENFISSDDVVMFSFTTCPFCRRAKDYLEENGIKYKSMELDELDGNEGNEIRAVLGRMTKRTSVPSIFIKRSYIGGCNDGNPGLLPLANSGELDKLLGRN